MVFINAARLRPTKAYLFADWLRTYVGLNCAETDEHHLLKMLLQEVQSVVSAEACGVTARTRMATLMLAVGVALVVTMICSGQRGSDIHGG